MPKHKHASWEALHAIPGGPTTFSRENASRA